MNISGMNAAWGNIPLPQNILIKVKSAVMDEYKWNECGVGQHPTTPKHSDQGEECSQGCISGMSAV